MPGVLVGQVRIFCQLFYYATVYKIYLHLSCDIMHTFRSCKCLTAGEEPLMWAQCPSSCGCYVFFPSLLLSAYLSRPFLSLLSFTPSREGIWRILIELRMFIFRLKKMSQYVLPLPPPASLPHISSFNQHIISQEEELIIDFGTLMPNNKKNNNSNSNQQVPYPILFV